MATKKSTTKAKTKSTKTVATKKTVKKSISKKPTKKAAVSKKATTSIKSKTTAKKVTPKKAAITKKSLVMPLSKLYVFGALFCATLAALVFAYGDQTTIAVTAQYAAENKLVETKELLPAIRQLFAINLVHVISVILVVSALWRLVVLTKYKNSYTDQVKAKLTTVNWLELGLIGPFVLMTIAAAAGVRDIMTLILVGSIVSITAVLGYLTDRYNMVGRKTLLKKKIALDVLLLPWLVIAASVWHTYLYGFSSLSASLYALLVAGFAAYLVLGYVHYRQIKASGKFSDFMYGEQWVQVMHLVLLELIALIVFL